MADELTHHFVQAALAIAGGVASWAATLLTTVKDLKKGVAELEGRVAIAEQRARVSGRTTLSPTAIEELVKRLLAQEIDRGLTDVRTQMSALREDLNERATEEQLARFVEGQGPRWEQIQHAMGNIEGRLTTIRDSLTLANSRVPRR